MVTKKTSSVAEPRHNTDETPVSQTVSAEKTAWITPALQEGMVISNRYRLEAWLGSGGMGVVYRACDVTNPRSERVAIKILNPVIAQATRCLEAWQDCLAASTSVLSETWVHVQRLVVEPQQGLAYIVMEYIAGSNLQSYLPETGAPVVSRLQAYQWIAEIAAGLAVAHQAGLVHGDLKPSNAIVEASNRIRLIDFGWVSALHAPWEEEDSDVTRFDVSHLGAFTPAYASYRVLMGNRPGPEDDLYALGCLAYSLLTGHHPFGKLNAVKVHSRQLLPATIPDVPKPLMRYLRQVLHTGDNAPRVTAAQCVAHCHAAIRRLQWEATVSRGWLGLARLCRWASWGLTAFLLSWGMWYGYRHVPMLTQQPMQSKSRAAAVEPVQPVHALSPDAAPVLGNGDWGTQFWPGSWGKARLLYQGWVEKALSQHDWSLALDYTEKGLRIFPHDARLMQYRERALSFMGSHWMQTTQQERAPVQFIPHAPVSADELSPGIQGPALWMRSLGGRTVVTSARPVTVGDYVIYCRLSGQCPDTTRPVAVSSSASSGMQSMFTDIQAAVQQYNWVCSQTGACEGIMEQAPNQAWVGYRASQQSAYLNWLNHTTGQHYRVMTAKEHHALRQAFPDAEKVGFYLVREARN